MIDMGKNANYMCLFSLKLKEKFIIIILPDCLHMFTS